MLRTFRGGSSAGAGGAQIVSSTLLNLTERNNEYMHACLPPSRTLTENNMCIAASPSGVQQVRACQVAPAAVASCDPSRPSVKSSALSFLGLVLRISCSSAGGSPLDLGRER